MTTKIILLIGDTGMINYGNGKVYSRCDQRFKAIQKVAKELDFKTVIISTSKDNINNKSVWLTSISSRIYFKLGYPLDVLGINQKILEFTENFKPSIIWIDKGILIKPNTLRKIRQLLPCVKLVLWSPEYIKLKHNRSSYLTASLNIYDYLISPMRQNFECSWVRKHGTKNLLWVPQGYDEDLHRPLPITQKEIEKFGSDIGFIGSFENSRAEKLLFLAENDLKVRVWGSGWNDWVDKHENLKVENLNLGGEDYIKAICANKINICFLRKTNIDRSTCRSVEIPSCGGFMLAERTKEHQEMLEENKEAVFFDINNKEELLQKARYYLNNFQERQHIALAARKRCLISKYSYFEILYTIIQSLID
jgi:spore maturation protein CgeB